MAKPQAQQTKYLIDKTLPRFNSETGLHQAFWRVYYWAERPDAERRAVDDKFHWHPDSEHATEEAAKKRLAELKAGVNRQSILDLRGLSISKH